MREADDGAEDTDTEGQSIEVCVPSDTWADGDGAGDLELAREDRDLWNTDWGSATGHYQADDSEMSALDQTPLDTLLAAHLCAQLFLMPLSTRDMTLACVVATSLDDDGYLRLPLDEIFEGMDLDPAPDDAERRIALCRVQALDPLGVGARDVKARCCALRR
jgi:RNA polymerase sigma-54 factor